MKNKIMPTTNASMNVRGNIQITFFGGVALFGS